MDRKIAGAVVLLLLALLLTSGAGATTKIHCSVHQAKNPSCGPRFRIDGTCGKQCKSEGYSGWICHDNCTCLICPYIDREQRLENEKIQKQGNKGVPAADVGAV